MAGPLKRPLAKDHALAVDQRTSLADLQRQGSQDSANGRQSSMPTRRKVVASSDDHKTAQVSVSIWEALSPKITAAKAVATDEKPDLDNRVANNPTLSAWVAHIAASTSA